MFECHGCHREFDDDAESVVVGFCATCEQDAYNSLKEAGWS